METSADTQEVESENKKEEDDATQERGGVKRQREDEDLEKDKDEKSDRVDPSSAPDPEEPEKFDESAMKSDFEEQFSPPEDDVTVTLDRCESIEERERDSVKSLAWCGILQLPGDRFRLFGAKRCLYSVFRTVLLSVSLLSLSLSLSHTHTHTCVHCPILSSSLPVCLIVT